MVVNNHTSTLFVISGPSGAGKGTLVGQLLSAVPNLWLSISTTSRKPRPGDKEGVDYHFISKDEFEKLIKEDAFIEYANVYGNYYGTPIDSIKNHLETGQNVVLEIDVQGGFQVRKHFPNAVLIFISPPSLEVLENRLRARQTDSEDSIANRLRIAKEELALTSEYDEIIINDDLKKATQDLVKVVQSHIGN